MTRVILDTSVLIGGQWVDPGLDTAISAVSVAELHFGMLRARDRLEAGTRATRLGLISARFPDPLPVDDRVAREWGRLLAVVADRGGSPRRRSSDLAIAATALVHGSALATLDRDLAIIDDLLEILPL